MIRRLKAARCLNILCCEKSSKGLLVYGIMTAVPAVILKKDAMRLTDNARIGAKNSASLIRKYNDNRDIRSLKFH